MRGCLAMAGKRLEEMAKSLLAHEKEILEENEKDLEAAKESISTVMR